MPWVATSDDVEWKRKGEVKVAVTDDDPVNARILKLATDLGNTVLAKKAANDLQTLVSLFFSDHVSHTNTKATVSSPKRCLGLTGHHSFTRSCRFSRHITSVSPPADSFWTFLISGCWSKLCLKRKTMRRTGKVVNPNLIRNRIKWVQTA